MRDYGLRDASWQDNLSAFTAALGVFPSNMAGALTAFALLPLVQRWERNAAMRPALHLVGTTGSGKSGIAALMTSFYGTFTRDTPPAQWGETVNTVEVLGYALADGLFWVHDWLLPNTTDGRLTIQKRIQGKRAWVWCLKREMLDGDTEDSG